MTTLKDKSQEIRAIVSSTQVELAFKELEGCIIKKIGCAYYLNPPIEPIVEIYLQSKNNNKYWLQFGDKWKLKNSDKIVLKPDANMPRRQTKKLLNLLKGQQVSLISLTKRQPWMYTVIEISLSENYILQLFPIQGVAPKFTQLSKCFDVMYQFNYPEIAHFDEIKK